MFAAISYIAFLPIHGKAVLQWAAGAWLYSYLACSIALMLVLFAFHVRELQAWKASLEYGPMLAVAAVVFTHHYGLNWYGSIGCGVGVWLQSAGVSFLLLAIRRYREASEI